jgi:hypothetical protein
LIFQGVDTSRDCRKSPKITILAISQLIKSITYKHQNYRFKVFRQSLNVSVISTAESYLKLTMRVGLRINCGVFRSVPAGRRAKNSNLEQRNVVLIYGFEEIDRVYKYLDPGTWRRRALSVQTAGA